jgi:hypothetical protein
MDVWQNWMWVALAIGAVVELDAIRRLLKGIHFMTLEDYKRRRPEVFED